MEVRKLVAKEGFIFAYKDSKGEEIKMSNILYLGKKDKGERYYEIEIEKEIVDENMEK